MKKFLIIGVFATLAFSGTAFAASGNTGNTTTARAIESPDESCGTDLDEIGDNDVDNNPCPSPIPSIIPTPTSTLPVETPTPTPTATPSETPSVTPSVSPTPAETTPTPHTTLPPSDTVTASETHSDNAGLYLFIVLALAVGIAFFTKSRMPR